MRANKFGCSVMTQLCVAYRERGECHEVADESTVVDRNPRGSTRVVNKDRDLGLQRRWLIDTISLPRDVTISLHGDVIRNIINDRTDCLSDVLRVVNVAVAAPTIVVMGTLLTVAAGSAAVEGREERFVSARYATPQRC
jgi:hypothetical protein